MLNTAPASTFQHTDDDDQVHVPIVKKNSRIRVQADTVHRAWKKSMISGRNEHIEGKDAIHEMDETQISGFQCFRVSGMNAER